MTVLSTVLPAYLRVTAARLLGPLGRAFRRRAIACTCASAHMPFRHSSTLLCSGESRFSSGGEVVAGPPLPIATPPALARRNSLELVGRSHVSRKELVVSSGYLLSIPPKGRANAALRGPVASAALHVVRDPVSRALGLRPGGPPRQAGDAGLPQAPPARRAPRPLRCYLGAAARHPTVLHSPTGRCQLQDDRASAGSELLGDLCIMTLAKA